MERALEQVSTAVRYRKGPFYSRKYGCAYGPGDKKLAEKWKRLKPYLELDVSTCILHTRILLDKAVALSRVFLRGPTLPNFNSFSHHKQFFVKNPTSIPGHAEYSRYMRDETSWFDVPIKFVRDKFYVHEDPRHHKVFSIGWAGDDNLTLRFDIVKADRYTQRDSISFNPWRMSYDVENFLKWFGGYGLKSFRRRICR